MTAGARDAVAEDFLQQRLEDIGGCSDGNCIVIRPRGQHTNGGCRCSRDSLTMQRLVNALKIEIERLGGNANLKRRPTPDEAAHLAAAGGKG
jgi:hypothetical protein